MSLDSHINKMIFFLKKEITSFITVYIILYFISHQSMVLSSEVKCITSKYHRPTFEIMTAPYRRLV